MEGEKRTQKYPIAVPKVEGLKLQTERASGIPAQRMKKTQSRLSARSPQLAEREGTGGTRGSVVRMTPNLNSRPEAGGQGSEAFPRKNCHGGQDMGRGPVRMEGGEPFQMQRVQAAPRAGCLSLMVQRLPGPSNLNVSQ